MQKLILLLGTVVLLALLMNGCESRDERLARFAEESTQQQARQNEQMAKQSQETAEASRRLLEADAQTRAEFNEQASQLQAERSEVSRQRDVLETERRDLAQQRHRDPLIAHSILSAALLLACLLPLLLCAYVLKVVGGANQDEVALNELLVHELISDKPRLLIGQASAPDRLERRPLPLEEDTGDSPADL